MSAYVNEVRKSAPIPPQSQYMTPESKTEDAIPVDGYRQVLEMLRAADPAFRESLLRRIAARDRNLAHDLRQEIDL